MARDNICFLLIEGLFSLVWMGAAFATLLLSIAMMVSGRCHPDVDFFFCLSGSYFMAGVILFQLLQFQETMVETRDDFLAYLSSCAVIVLTIWTAAVEAVNECGSPYSAVRIAIITLSSTLGILNVCYIRYGCRHEKPQVADDTVDLHSNCIVGHQVEVQNPVPMRAPAVTRLLGAVMTEILDDNLLASMQNLLETNPDWLGKGRDVPAVESPLINTPTVQPYSKLLLAKAWQVQHDVEESRYRLAKEEVAMHMTTLGSVLDRLPDIQTETSGSSVKLGLHLDTSLNESIALHGTTPAALPGILSSGLSESMSSGAAFGDGTYLAEDAGKCDQYCRVEDEKQECVLHKALYPDDRKHLGGVCYLIVCQALLGLPAQTLDGKRRTDGGDLWAHEHGKRELAIVTGCDVPIHYHSLLVEPGQAVKRYREIVMFRRDRVLVKYFIAYKREA